MTQAETQKPAEIRRVYAGTQRESTVQDDLPVIRFNAALVAKCFAIFIPCLVVFGAIANYAVFNLAPHPDHPIADVLKRFDLGHEPSIPAFYSASVMLASAAFLVFLGWHDRSADLSRRRYWFALSLLFLGLAIDESVMFHEMGTAAMDRMNLGGAFYFSWIIPGAIFAMIVGGFFSRFLMTLNKRTRSLLILSGVVFLSGAIGMEFIAGLIFQEAASEEEAMRSVSHVIVQAVEEGLEMTGVAIFLCALIDYADISGLRIVLGGSRVTS